MKTLLALLAGAKFGKILLTSGTMLLSVITYSFIYGWWYAVGFLGLILCHEMGHFLAARQRGLDVGAPTFIPFVGAWIQLKEQPMDVETEAYVAMAGPVVGTIAVNVRPVSSYDEGLPHPLNLHYHADFYDLLCRDVEK